MILFHVMLLLVLVLIILAGFLEVYCDHVSGEKSCGGGDVTHCWVSKTSS
jgi:hypothetical protein